MLRTKDGDTFVQQRCVSFKTTNQPLGAINSVIKGKHTEIEYPQGSQQGEKQTSSKSDTFESGLLDLLDGIPRFSRQMSVDAKNLHARLHVRQVHDSQGPRVGLNSFTLHPIGKKHNRLG